MSVGSNIKRLRKQLGMSAETLAAIIGVSPTTIYRYENGDIEKVDSTKLEHIAEALRTTPAVLMGWDDEASSAGHALDNALSAELRDMSDEDKQDVLDYMRFRRAQRARRDP